MFLHPPVFSPLPPGLLLNLKRRRKERQKEKHERIRESRVEGGPREKERRGEKQREKVSKEIPSRRGWRGTSPDSFAKQASKKKGKERGCRCWLGDVCIGYWFPGFSGCSGWDLSDCLNTGPTVRHCSGAVGASSYTSTTSTEAQRWPSQLPMFLYPVSKTVTSSLGEQCQGLERAEKKKEKEGRRERPEQLVHPGCHPETGKGNEECACGSVRTSWVIHDVLCENASCVLCVSCSFLFSPPFFL